MAITVKQRVRALAFIALYMALMFVVWAVR